MTLIGAYGPEPSRTYQGFRGPRDNAPHPGRAGRPQPRSRPPGLPLAFPPGEAQRISQAIQTVRQWGEASLTKLNVQKLLGQREGRGPTVVELESLCAQAPYTATILVRNRGANKPPSQRPSIRIRGILGLPPGITWVEVEFSPEGKVTARPVMRGVGSPPALDASHCQNITEAVGQLLLQEGLQLARLRRQVYAGSSQHGLSQKNEVLNRKIAPLSELNT